MFSASGEAFLSAHDTFLCSLHHTTLFCALCVTRCFWVFSTLLNASVCSLHLTMFLCVLCTQRGSFCVSLPRSVVFYTCRGSSAFVLLLAADLSFHLVCNVCAFFGFSCMCSLSFVCFPFEFPLFFFVWSIGTVPCGGLGLSFCSVSILFNFHFCRVSFLVSPVIY